MSGKCRVEVLARQMSSQTFSNDFLLKQIWLKSARGKNQSTMGGGETYKHGGMLSATAMKKNLQIISIRSDDFTGVAQSSRESAKTEGNRRRS